MQQDLDFLVLGSGLRGLGAALATMRAHPTADLLVVDRAAQPGGRIRTQRSNGFACELGPFAFERTAIEPLLGLLHQPPARVAARPEAHRGHLFTGTGLVPTPVDPLPVSFAGGTEDMIQACRRELGPRLRLGRAATAVHPTPTGWEVALGGEAPSAIRARHLALALPLDETARLLEDLDRELAMLRSRLRSEPRAFAFFGGHAGDAPELRGYGVLPGDEVETPIAEAIFCSEVFPGRAMPGRFLVRCEVAGPVLAQDDPAVLAAAAAELRRWTGVRAPFGFTKLHRFLELVSDATLVECRVRLQGLAARATNLTVP